MQCFLTVVLPGDTPCFMRASSMAFCSGVILARISGGIGGTPVVSLVVVASHIPGLTSSGGGASAAPAAPARRTNPSAYLAVMLVILSTFHFTGNPARESAPSLPGVRAHESGSAPPATAAQAALPEPERLRVKETAVRTFVYPASFERGDKPGVLVIVFRDFPEIGRAHV